MVRRLLAVGLGILMTAGVARAGSVAVSFSDVTAQVAFDQGISEDAWGSTQFGLRGLYNDRRDSWLTSGGIDILSNVEGTGLELGAGLRAYYVDADKDNVLAGGMGARIKFTPPAFQRASLAGSLYYCPKVFTGLDGERLLDTEVVASFEIIPRATVFLSYTTIRAAIKDHGERTVDDTFRGGLRLSF